MPFFSNKAQLSYKGIKTNSNIAYGQIVEVLSASKNAVSDSYTIGDRVTYVLNIVNSGTTAFSNLTINDNLGGYTFSPTTGDAVTLYPLSYVVGSMQLIVNGIQQAQPTITTTNGITITGINIPAGGNATIIYQADVNEYAPGGTTDSIVNTVSVTGTELSTTLTATHTLNVSNSPKLSIVKSICPAQVSENGLITYTFSIQNLGNTATTAEDQVQILDTFNPILSNLTVTYNGTTLSTNDYSYNATTGVFSTNSGIINVPAATYTQDAQTGVRTITPGTSVVTVSGGIKN